MATLVTVVSRDDRDRYYADLGRAFKNATPEEKEEWISYLVPHSHKDAGRILTMKILLEIKLMEKYGTYDSQRGYLAMTHEDMEKYEKELEDENKWPGLPIYDYKQFFLTPSKRQKR